MLLDSLLEFSLVFTRTSYFFGTIELHAVRTDLRLETNGIKVIVYYENVASNVCNIKMSVYIYVYKVHIPK